MSSLSSGRYVYSIVGNYEVTSLSTSIHRCFQDCEVLLTNIPDSLDLSDVFYLLMTHAFVHELRMSIKNEKFGRLAFAKLDSQRDAMRVVSTLNEFKIEENIFMRATMAREWKVINLKGFTVCEEQVKEKIQKSVSSEISITKFVQDEDSSCSVHFLTHYDASFFKRKMKVDDLSIFENAVICMWSLTDTDSPPDKKRKLWSSAEIQSCKHHIYRISVNNLAFLKKDASKENIISYTKNIFNIEFEDMFENIDNFPSEEVMDYQKKVFDEMQATKCGDEVKVSHMGIAIIQDVIKDIEKISVELHKFTPE